MILTSLPPSSCTIHIHGVHELHGVHGVHGVHEVPGAHEVYNIIHLHSMSRCSTKC